MTITEKPLFKPIKLKPIRPIPRNPKTIKPKPTKSEFTKPKITNPMPTTPRLRICELGFFFVLQFREIVYLTGMHKITILQMIRYGDRIRTKAEVVRLFQEEYPELPPISQGTVKNQMHPYKLVPINEFAEDDFDRRSLFCEQMMQMIDDNTLQIENVLFSDESTFTLHGHVNRKNCRYWSGEDPHWMRELHTQNPEKVNVWEGIIGENVIGPFFIDGNLNGETYSALLR
ncbi:hypothetical protein NQ318_009518 [Aromia moschata]|uniref:Transposase n=1 Tax=Aromia moschata TaxID=1265417 RepID=A0AAV8Z8Z1_9CUCU|nr:hypothetical protein NQ318_009518 [Aromia moschata]